MDVPAEPVAVLVDGVVRGLGGAAVAAVVWREVVVGTRVVLDGVGAREVVDDAPVLPEPPQPATKRGIRRTAKRLTFAG